MKKSAIVVVTNILLIMTMLAVGRMLILTRTKYGSRAYYVHWYCGYRWIPVDLQVTGSPISASASADVVVVG